MEGLVPATATVSTFQLILEHLCAVLLLIAEGLRHDPALPAFLWLILVGALVVVCLKARRRHTSRSGKAPGEGCPAHEEVSAGRSEDAGPKTEAGDAPQTPGVEAGPLRLQTLCLKALNRHLSRMLSLQDLADSVRASRQSRPPQRSHVTGETPTSKASGTDGERLQKNVTDGLNKDTRYPESPEMCRGDIMGQEQDIREREEEEQRLQPSKAPLEQVLQGRVSPSVSTAGNPLRTSPRPEVLGGRLAHVTVRAEPQREAGNRDQLIHGSEDGLGGVPRDADLNVSLLPADEDEQGRARELWEQKQINGALAGDLASLRAEKASLQRENSSLSAEVEQLKLKLQMVPDTHEGRLAQLRKQLSEAEGRCSEMEEKLLSDWRSVHATDRMLDTYKKMARDMNQDLQRSAFYYEREIRYHWERAEAAQMAAEHVEKQLQELQRENDRHRQLLAKAKAKATFQPFPGGPFTPTAPPAAPRGPEVPVRPPGPWVPRKDRGHAGRAKKCRVTFQV
ncbi:hypothetical protein HJG60_010455 [Phyllostomus discolor]|uniref:Melanoma inhibitory activity protein 2 n=1 Tax=Phyllostomus discolor TaxID=89673 RepID=A0A834EF21_9CHIR|nr:hypothetical protein HJG60_010455 [Phyllostomus discolor]